MLTRWVAIFCVLLVGFFSPRVSLAAIDLSLVGVGNLSTLNTKSETSTTRTKIKYSSNIGLGGGVLSEFRFSGAFGLEVGGLYTSRSMQMDSLSVTTTASTVTTNFTASDTTLVNVSYLEVPILLRFRPAKFLSIGVGPYGGLLVGNVSTENQKTGLSTSNSSSNSGLKSLDYGAVGALGFLFYFDRSMGITVDARYLYGLADVTTTSSSGTTTSGTYQAMQAFLGLRLKLGYKEGKKRGKSRKQLRQGRSKLKSGKKRLRKQKRKLSPKTLKSDSPFDDSLPE